MLPGVGVAVLSWLDLVYGQFPLIHFGAAKHSAPCSLIISVNRHFNDLCFVFGFPAFCLYIIHFFVFSACFLLHWRFLWYLVLVFGLLFSSSMSIYMLNCHCPYLFPFLFPFPFLRFLHSPHSHPHPCLPSTSSASSSGRLLSIGQLGGLFQFRYQRPVIFNKHRCPLSWISFH